MSENDAVVSNNLQRMVGQMVEDLSNREAGATTFDEYRTRRFSEIERAMNMLFPELHFSGVDDPLNSGTFLFTKGAVERFRYANLSGGEKAAFDLLLDLSVKRHEYFDSIYCIDEPELHLNPSTHGRLLDALLQIIPTNSQLWLATHSIGIMRRAINIEQAQAGSVVFLDFSGQNFDEPVVLKPIMPTRSFWINSLDVALADLAALVGPQTIIVCEGIGPGKNGKHDADCYNVIFAKEYPESLFIGGGNAHDVRTDRFTFVMALPEIVQGVTMRRVIDRDDRAPGEVAELKAKGTAVLRRRSIEAYLWDCEVLEVLCKQENQEAAFEDVMQLKRDALTRAHAEGAALDDMKAAAGYAYVAIKRRLNLVGVGNDYRAFERETLAPLISPEMDLYRELKTEIFD
jgi:hypothetical protein